MSLSRSLTGKKNTPSGAMRQVGKAERPKSALRYVGQGENGWSSCPTAADRLKTVKRTQNLTKNWPNLAKKPSRKKDQVGQARRFLSCLTRFLECLTRFLADREFQSCYYARTKNQMEVFLYTLFSCAIPIPLPTLLVGKSFLFFSEMSLIWFFGL